MPLTITIPARSGYDEKEKVFFPKKPVTLKLEHSLVSVSKWESKWRKPFFSVKNNDKTEYEIRDYVRCMCITQNVDEKLFYGALSPPLLNLILKYIGDTPTATTIRETNSPSKRAITSELIYYWMFSYHIPKECEKWHLGRLLMLIRVFNEEQNPSGKMDAKSREALNNARRAQRKRK